MAAVITGAEAPFIFRPLPFVGRRSRSEEEAMRNAKEEMEKGGELWDD